MLLSSNRVFPKHHPIEKSAAGEQEACTFAPSLGGSVLGAPRRKKSRTDRGKLRRRANIGFCKYLLSGVELFGAIMAIELAILGPLQLKCEELPFGVTSVVRSSACAPSAAFSFF